ncbi:hypothetical protein ONZ45_g1269 [Pleurotus djamor]|nr:hypothetical protein ONZ45_g1269 [Pleurotus djamor]
MAASSSRIVDDSHHRPASIDSQPAGFDRIGKPILFSTGQFAGRLVRAELVEIQKANLGRKYAKVDRRPLDPPPVVQLKLYATHNEGGVEHEVEIQDYESVQCHGLLCTVDLFPIQASPSTTTSSQSPSSSSSHMTPPAQQSPTRGGHFNVNYLTAQAYTQQAVGLASSSAPSLSTQAYAMSTEVVHRVGDIEITEGSKKTQALVGATFVQPATFDYQGRKSLVFVFSDLAVKIEGTFLLRYRFFDLTVLPSGCEHFIIQAECYGGPFQVYSTKEFPGLQASTELTKQLARWGVRLNIRETERKRRKKDARSVSPATPSRKRSFHSASEAGNASDS